MRSSYSWTLTGGAVGTADAGSTGSTLDFTAGPAGTLTLYCTATNQAGTTSAAGTAEVRIVPPTYTFTAMVGDGVTGAPDAGVSLISGDAGVSWSYSPSAGDSSAMVQVDGQFGAASGSLALNANHWLFAFGQPATGTATPLMMAAPDDAALIPAFFCATVGA